jgi:hypothetical protein
MNAIKFFIIMVNILIIVGFMIWSVKNTGRYRDPRAAIALNILVMMISVAFLVFGLGYQTRDIEIWNGEVTSKGMTDDSYDESYPCNCDSKGSCQTCWRHVDEYNWHAYTTVGDIKVGTTDSPRRIPKRYDRIVIGEPAACDHYYTNYIKASPESLFNASAEKAAFEKYKKTIIPYPDSIYDYYKISRVLGSGVSVPNQSEWAKDISFILSDIGPQKQVNVVVYITDVKDGDYFYALKHAWLGGKKNDVIVVMSATNSTINWVKILSWTDNQLFKTKLADEIQDIGDINKYIDIDRAIRKNIIESFQRKHMKDFKYLESEESFPVWVWIVDGIILAVAFFLNLIYVRSK